MTLGLQQKNEMGEAGAAALGEMLKVNSSLQTLLLAGNRIGEAGVLSLAEGLRVNSSLQMLDLVSALILL